MRYIVGYGLPLIVMTATLLAANAINDNDLYIHTDGNCWLHENSWIYCFVGPVAVVLLINTAIFIKALRVATIARRRLNSSNTMKIFGQMKNWFILSFLLGLIWAFGFLIQPGIEFIAYIFVILTGSSGIFLFIHTVLMNEVILLEVKIFLGLHSKDELGMEHSNSRLMASKSFHRAERPKVVRRTKPRESTSSEEMPDLPRPPRKFIKKNPRVQMESDREHWPRRESIYFEQSTRANYIPSTAENTSLSSANSSLKSTASNEQSSSESLAVRRRLELARHRARLQRQSRIRHDRVQELQEEPGKSNLSRRQSNKW